MEKLLCQPFSLGGMNLRNRIVMPPMVVRFATDDGFITDRSVAYYGARAKGGAGLIIQEATFVRPDGQILANEPAIYDDRFIPGLRRVTEAIHRHGAKAAVQLIHGGRTAFFGIPGVPIGPSPVAAPGYSVPKEMSLTDIGEVIDTFARAAYRARQAGYDAVEIHGAHGYLIDQFISPIANRRGDAYGGSVANRARLLVEVIGAVREALGRSFPVWCRINGREFGTEGGETLEDAREVARLAEKAGACAIHVSATGPAVPLNYPQLVFSPGLISDLAAGIKTAVDVPIIAVGSMTPDFAEKLLREGKADLIAFGRALFADPELPNKVCSGGTKDVRPCILCFHCRDGLRLRAERRVCCAVNAAMGKEKAYEIVKTDKAKRVLVVGGGPAGLESARVVALRGHQVTLWEKESRLGGQLNVASVAPYKGRIEALPRYYARELKNLGVTVKLGKKGTPGQVVQFAPEVLVLATGAKPIVPKIRGLSKAYRVSAVDVLWGRAEVKGERVVIIGGEQVACEVAMYLSGRGKRVTMVRRGPEMAARAGGLGRFVLNRLKAEGVTMLTGVTYREANEKGLVVTTKEGEKLLEADTIVLAAGAEPEKGLYEKVKDKVAEVKLVGDAVTPRNIADAISDGYQAGLSI
ncbi:MAG: FAD-dependent oxidoreductase [Chloroflexota bacterium]